jgi:membrane-bound lytic murein transglycosylase B
MFTAAIVFASALLAASDLPKPVPRPNRIAYLRAELGKHGFSREEIRTILAHPLLDPHYRVPLGTRKINWTRLWAMRRAELLSSPMLSAALRYFKENRDAVLLAEYVYNVAREDQVAIIGVETNYGAFLGDHGVANALYGMFLKSPRESRWRSAAQNFAALFAYARREEIENPFAFCGSWAGAMGAPQFMPLSILAYGVDGDCDGDTDIFSPADAHASQANFARAHGYRRKNRFARMRFYSAYYGSGYNAEKQSFFGYPVVVDALREALQPILQDPARPSPP